MNHKLLMEKYIRARINEVDEKHLDPEQRSQLFNAFILEALGYPRGLPDPSTNNLYWDLVCFCTEFMNMVVSNVGEQNSLIAQKLISDLIYNMHYSTDMKGLGPGRDEEEAVWVERIMKMKRLNPQDLVDESVKNDNLVEEGEKPHEL